MCEASTTMARGSDQVPEQYRPLRDELWKLVLEADVAQLGKRLLAISEESERKALGKPVYHLFRQIWNGKIKGMAGKPPWIGRGALSTRKGAPWPGRWEGRAHVVATGAVSFGWPPVAPAARAKT